jgi:hypothetical protein
MEVGNMFLKKIFCSESGLEEALNSVGIRTRCFLNNNKYRSLTKVLNDVAKKWNKFSGLERSTISKYLGIKD